MKSKLAIAFLLLLSACGPGAEAPDGRELYLAYGCAACHGEQADGNGPSAGLSYVRPRDLRNLHSFSGPRTAEGIATTIAFGIADGRTGMPAYPDIPKRERLAIAEYIRALAAEPRSITIDQPWVAESNPAWKIAAAYFSIANHTATPLALVGASTADAKSVEMHEMATADGMMTMRQIETIAIPANGTTRLQPGGTHLMLIDLGRDLRARDSVLLTLRFDDGSTRTITAPVRRATAPAATSPAPARTEAPAAAAATPAFTLIDHEGRTLDAPLRGRSALVFFGYTRCPDACPMTLSKIARAYRLGGPATREVSTLFISVDPRDTPDVLRRYLTYFANVPARGLTGSKEQIDAAVQQFGARYEIRDTGSAAGPTVDHTLTIFVLDREGRIAKKFNPATVEPKEIAEALKAL